MPLLLFAIVDEEASPPVVVARFETEAQAVAWLDAYHDQEKVWRGGFGLDAPDGYLARRFWE